MEEGREEEREGNSWQGRRRKEERMR